jgi:predicted unusual protein kinase regulating ubiquinone biosynthesis (AarF/ABC1/UbiB family)/nucleotide-binding universal stress UspA family protein
MVTTREAGPAIRRVMVGTDRSETADRAVRWAAHLANPLGAELLVLQVLLPSPPDEDGNAPAEDERMDAARTTLHAFATELAGPRGRAQVVVDPDPVQAILDCVERERVDVLVVGNVGMSGRKEFLLGNIPNRISHNARCTVIIVNTALTRDAGVPRRTRATDTPAETEGQLMRRAAKIARILAQVGAREVLTRTPGGGEEATRAMAQRVRGALDALGPTFAKLGQILSTRPDLLPPVFIEELSTLQDRVTPLTEAEVVAAMERELQVPWEDVFASIDPKPLAAGTIAQVHRGTLESGERVVVKVQRPNAEQDILQDVALLEMFAARAGERPAFRRVFDIPAMIEHLTRSLRRELDFRQEAANIRRMREVLEPYDRLDVPRVYDDLSTARLLVMEEIQGGPVLQAPEGEARNEAARQLLEAYYHQVMTEGFFHADPHPGNMKWWNDKIYFLDLGMVGQVPPEVCELVLLLLLAFSQKDGKFLADITLALASLDRAPEGVDFAAFQADLEGVIARYRDKSLREIQLGPILQEMMQISVRHNIRLPASLMLMGKAFAQMQLVAADLNPSLDPFAAAESFILRRTMRQVTERLNPQQLFYEVQKARVRLTRVLEGIEGLVGARPGYTIPVQFGGTERLEATISQSSRRLSLALGMSSALIVSAVTANSRRIPRWVPALAGSIGSLLAAGLVADRPRRG